VARRITVRGIPRPEPDVRLYVLALIELARQLPAEEESAKGGQALPPESPMFPAEDDSDD
jgi:hypothetical protein